MPYSNIARFYVTLLNSDWSDIHMYISNPVCSTIGWSKALLLSPPGASLPFVYHSKLDGALLCLANIYL